MTVITNRSLLILLAVVALCVAATAQPHQRILSGDSLDRPGGIDLSCCLEHAATDAPYLADPRSPDSLWQPIVMGGGNEGLVVGSPWNSVGWFRARFTVSERSRNKALGVSVFTLGACEIYLDGTLIHTFGNVGGSGDGDQIPNDRIFPLDPFLDRSDPKAIHTIAFRVRTASAPFHTHGGAAVSFGAVLGGVEDIYQRSVAGRSRFHRNLSIPYGIIIALAVLHMLMYLFDRRSTVNLMYAGFAITFSGIFFCWHVQNTSTDPQWMLASLWIINILWILIVVEALLLISMLLYGKISRRRWIISGSLGALVLLLPMVLDGWGTKLWGAFATVAAIDLGWNTVTAIKRRQEGAWVVGLGLLLFSLYILGWFFGFYLGWITIEESLWRVIFISGLVSMPLSMSIFLARKISATNADLSTQLLKVEDLTAQKLHQERRAIEEEIRRQQLEVENDRKSHELEEARKLQFSMLPTTMPSSGSFRTALAMNTATEVGGDYVDYYVHDADHITFAIGDATGHGMKAGVMVATTKSHFQTHALTGTHAEILGHTSQGIQKLHLRGLYMCLALLTIKGRQATWTAAGIPALMHYRAATGTVDHHLVKGLPLGMPHHGTATSIEFTVEPDDVMLLLTDGLPELFDPQRSSLGNEPIEEVLVSHGSKEPQAIVEALLELADDWRAGQPYNDDVTLMVIKVTS